MLFRRREGELQIFLAHPGGPFWKHKDAGAWTIPKGLIDQGEEPLAAAQREFEEETGFKPSGPYLPLGIDRCEWFSAPNARKKLNPAQVELVGRLEAALNEQSE